MLALLLFPFTLVFSVFGWIFGFIGSVLGWVFSIFGTVFGRIFGLAGGVLGVIVRLGMYAGVAAVIYIAVKALIRKKKDRDDPVAQASRESFKSFYEDRSSSVS